jgi:SAM-dependent methyltransferase
MLVQKNVVLLDRPEYFGQYGNSSVALDLSIVAPDLEMYNVDFAFCPPEEHLECKQEFDLVSKNNLLIYIEQQRDLLNNIYDETKEGGSLFYIHPVVYTQNEIYYPYTWVSRTQWQVYQEIILVDESKISPAGPNRFMHVDRRMFWLTKNDPVAPLPKDAAGRKTVWYVSFDDYKNSLPASLVNTIVKAILQDSQGVVFIPYIWDGSAIREIHKMGKDFIAVDPDKEKVDSINKELKLLAWQ